MALKQASSGTSVLLELFLHDIFLEEEFTMFLKNSTIQAGNQISLLFV